MFHNYRDCHYLAGKVLKLNKCIDTSTTNGKKNIKKNLNSPKFKEIDKNQQNFVSKDLMSRIGQVSRYKKTFKKNKKEKIINFLCGKNDKNLKVIMQKEIKLMKELVRTLKIIYFFNKNTIKKNSLFHDLQVKSAKIMKRSKKKATRDNIHSDSDGKIEGIMISCNYDDFYGCDYSMAEFLVTIKHYYYSLYYCFRILFVHLLPCLSLIVINALLLKTMWQGQSRRSRLLKMNRLSESRRVAEVNRTTMMLVVVVALFLVVELPSCIFFTLFVLKNSLSLKIMEDIKQAEIAVFVVNLCILLSYPMNFFIYCAMSTQFRNSFVELFRNIKNSAIESHSVRPLPSNQKKLNKNCEILLENV